MSSEAELAAQPEKRTYSVEEAGKLLGVGRNAAYDAAKRGQIPVIRIGRRLLVPKVAFDLLVENGKLEGRS